MLKLTATLLFLLSCTLACFSQQATVKGIITDTAEKKSLSNSVIALLKSADSTLVKFTRSNKDGTFSISNIPAGNYLLLVTHPTYADFFTPTSLKDTSIVDMATVPMILRSQLLEQVIVRQQLGAIRLKKDTTEYIADSFKVAANASVEDLLKRLPGIQVDKDGKIKTQGEEVRKVLVDGEEFFGDDPTMATQNIRADAVEKVQVFDKQSDQAAFTGIDDGSRTKTINLKLKEDKKNGYFGKVTLGGGLKDKFNNQAMINAFKKKRKFAVYGIMSNTGRTGLGWGDRSTYGGAENNMEFDEGSGGMMIFNSGDDFDGGGGSFYGEGLPTSWSAGTHYSNKFNGDKDKLNLNYQFKKLNTIGSGATTTQYLLTDSSYFRNERGNSFSQRIRNNVSGSYEMQLDSSSTLKITANGSIGKTINNNFSYNETLSGFKAPVNTSNRNTNSRADNQSLNTTLLWRKKFAKKGRTISINFGQNYSNNESDGFLYSSNQIFSPLLIKDTVDQEKINNSNKLSFNGKASYTEPLSKSVTLEVNYGISNGNSESERITYDKKDGKYQNYIDSLSSHYSVNVLTNSGGATLRINKKTINFSFGGTVSNAAFEQKDLRKDTLISYTYLNLFPRANINWNINPQKRLSIRYSGSTRQPTIEQLQPLNDNNDPFYERKGNPNLKQEFNHDITVSFNDYKVLNNRSIYLQATIVTVNNAISTNDELGAGGKRISQPFNVSGNYRYYSYMGYGFKLKKSDFNINFNTNLSGSRNNSLINNKIISNNSGQYQFGISTNYSKEKKIEFNVGVDAGYNTSKSSTLINNYWSTTFNSEVTVYLPWKTLIKTNADLNIRQKTPLFTQNRNVYLLNGTFSKKIFKGETGLLSFEMKDVLNQNLGFNRDISDGFIQERTYETIRRFWLLSFTWNFSKNGKAPSNPWE